jgi:hypothetical protein
MKKELPTESLASSLKTNSVDMPLSGKSILLIWNIESQKKWAKKSSNFSTYSALFFSVNANLLSLLKLEFLFPFW